VSSATDAAAGVKGAILVQCESPRALTGARRAQGNAQRSLGLSPTAFCFVLWEAVSPGVGIFRNSEGGIIRNSCPFQGFQDSAATTTTLPRAHPSIHVGGESVLATTPRLAAAGNSRHRRPSWHRSRLHAPPPPSRARAFPPRSAAPGLARCPSRGMATHTILFATDYQACCSPRHRMPFN
jgi:hypothetical protein